MALIALCARMTRSANGSPSTHGEGVMSATERYYAPREIRLICFLGCSSGLSAATFRSGHYVWPSVIYGTEAPNGVLRAGASRAAGQAAGPGHVQVVVWPGFDAFADGPGTTTSMSTLNGQARASTSRDYGLGALCLAMTQSWNFTTSLWRSARRWAGTEGGGEPSATET